MFLEEVLQLAAVLCVLEKKETESLCLSNVKSMVA